MNNGAEPTDREVAAAERRDAARSLTLIADELTHALDEVRRIADLLYVGDLGRNGTAAKLVADAINRLTQAYGGTGTRICNAVRSAADADVSQSRAAAHGARRAAS